jgi:predicted DNA-binding ribbon-helix-helix protein
MITGEDKTQKLIIIPKFVLDKLNAIAEKRSVTATKLINDVLYDFVNKK